MFKYLLLRHYRILYVLFKVRTTQQNDYFVFRTVLKKTTSLGVSHYSKYIFGGGSVVADWWILSSDN